MLFWKICDFGIPDLALTNTSSRFGRLISLPKIYSRLLAMAFPIVCIKLTRMCCKAAIRLFHNGMTL